MPSIVSANVAQVVMSYDKASGENYQNTYHVHKATAWTVSELEDIVSVFENWETTDASLKRSDNIQCVRITATDLTSLTSGRVDRQLAAPIVGGNVSPVLPANVTWAIKAGIGERGKGRNGRTFWIGLATNDVVGDVIVTLKGQDILASLNNLVALVTTGPPVATLGIIHNGTPAHPIVPATFSPIIGFTATDYSVDSQRDRLPFHKKHKKPTP